MANKAKVRWTILGKKKRIRYQIYAWCLCSCGTKRWVREHTIGKDSLGCSKCSTGVSTHGMSKSRIHNIWCAMKDRCANKNHIEYKRYGKRGISVCEEWKSSFTIFHEWAKSNGYEKHLTIDRISADKNYDPSNCRWATYAEQSRNSKRNIRIVYLGRDMILTDWCNELKLPYNTIRDHIRVKGMAPINALIFEINKRNGDMPV